MNERFTEAALAGLASTEDFTSIRLKSSDEATYVNEYPPFKDVMLIQVKGVPQFTSDFIKKKIKFFRML
jgi:hypothetical protein